MSELLSLLRGQTRGAATLRQIYLVYGGRPKFVEDAIAVLRHSDPETACRAAWLLDRAARDARIEKVQLVCVARAAEDAGDWASRAHLCHLFSITGCPTSLRATVFPFLEDCFHDHHAAMRCWALTAMLRFADDPEYAAEIAGFVATARNDPNKATQARLRQLGLVAYPPKPPRSPRPIRRRSRMRSL